MAKSKRPEIGVALLIVRDKKILLSPRLKKYGYGKLALPGGHVEWMESLKTTAIRETFEETGIKLNPKHVFDLRKYTEEVHPKLGKHYVTFYLIASMPKNQEPKNMEPHKHGPWNWYDPFKLPKRTWTPTKNLCGALAGMLIRAFIARGTTKRKPREHRIVQNAEYRAYHFDKENSGR